MALVTHRMVEKAMEDVNFVNRFPEFSKQGAPIKRSGCSRCPGTFVQQHASFQQVMSTLPENRLQDLADYFNIGTMHVAITTPGGGIKWAIINGRKSGT